MVAADPVGLQRAAAVLRDGGLVAMPTETVYGLGGDAMDVRAVARIFEAKGRPRFDPLIVHVSEAVEAWALAAEVPEVAKRLAEAFWPGPLTLVLLKRRGAGGVPDLVTAGLDTFAVRVPGHEVARRLIELAGCPVAAPSANRFGSISPTRAEHVMAELGGREGGREGGVDLIVDGGPCGRGIESTVVNLAGDVPTLLRPGAVDLEALRAVVGEVAIAGDATATQGGAQASPGMNSRHYAPRTPLMLAWDGTGREAAIRAAGAMTVEGGPAPIGLLTLAGDADLERALAPRTLAVLSESGNLVEAAASLFTAMRTLDEVDLKLIVVGPIPECGLGRAIRDRLKRAAMPF